MEAGTRFIGKVYAALRHWVQQFLDAIRRTRIFVMILLRLRAIFEHRRVSVIRVDCVRDISR
jgi:hypothetical protein